MRLSAKQLMVVLPRKERHMSSTYLKGAVGACLVALLASTAPGAAQQGGYGPPPGNAYGPPPQQGYSEAAPPQGQYAEPPPGAEGGGEYDDQSQQTDSAYADAYSRWAAQYCVNQANNTAAGAVIGGILGAGIGAAVGGGRGALVGGAVGVGTGAVAGAASAPGGCPPGYVVAAGAPAFVYAGGPYVAWGPAWYRPWAWVGGRWVYRPYRAWYWGHQAYWRPGWRGRPVRWRRRW